MIRQKAMLLGAAIIAAVLTINAQAMPMACSVTYSDGLSCGVCSCPLSPTTTQAATLNSSTCPCVSGGDCWKAVINNAYAFSYACSITLPEVGKTYDGGYFDQTFHDTTKTHEDWHYEYRVALVGKTYGALETWSASYAGNCWHTAAEALSLGYSDLQNALTTAENAFSQDFYKDRDIYEPGSYCHIVDIDGVPTWRSVNPDWGAAAVTYASGISVSFTTSPGNCECVPEPVSSTMVVLGLGTAVSVLRRRKTLCC